LLDNFSQAEKVLQTIAEDEGTAIANNEAKLNTIEARITKFKNATQHLTADIFQPELIKDVIDGGTKLVNILDTIIQKTGALTPVMGLLGAATTAKGGGIVGGLRDAYKNSKQPYVNPYAGVSVSQGQFEVYQSMFENNMLDSDMATKALSTFDQKQIDLMDHMVKNNMAFVQQSQALQQLGESAKEGTSLLSGFANKASVAFSKFGDVLLNAGISMLISAAISKMVEFGVAVATFNNTMASLRSSSGTELKEYNESLDEYKGKINDLYGVINDENSSIEQVTKARKDLREIQKQIIDMCGDEATALGIVTDAINGQTDALDKLSEKKYYELLDAYANQRNSAQGKVNRFFTGLYDKANGRKTYNTAQEEIQASIENYTADLEGVFRGIGIEEVRNVFKTSKHNYQFGEFD